MLATLRNIGRSLLLPIAVMPIAALLLRLGAPDLLDIPFIMASGAAVMDNLPILFAIGIATGLSTDHRGEAVLAAIVGYYVLIGALSALLMQIGYAASDLIVVRLSSNILFGLIAGLVAVWTYNRFYQVNLPNPFRFFSERRLPPILTPFFTLIISLILLLLWPLLWNGLSALNQFILGWGAFGTAVFAFLNRLLLPFGLHHVLNSYFWYGLGQYSNQATGQIVTGDIPRFLNGDPTAGAYQVGFYPIMMGGLIGAALAIVLAARHGHKARVGGLIGGAALVSLITGITEPLEFAFLFAAPYLYAIHALLTAVSSFIANSMGLRHGFAFSAGLIDYFLNFGLAERPVDLAILTMIFFLTYFLIFYLVIEIFHLKTPGRGGYRQPRTVSEEILKAEAEGEDEATIQARGILAALGGEENVTAVARDGQGLHLTVHSAALANESELIILGADTVAILSSQDINLTLANGEGRVAAEMVRLLSDDQPHPEEDEARMALEGPATVADPFTEARVKMFIDALGGGDNITSVESTAATRLRVTLNDPLLVDEEALRAAGSSGVMHTTDSVHILVGTKAGQYATEMQAQLGEATF